MRSTEVQRRALGLILWAHWFDARRIERVARFLEDTNLCLAPVQEMTQVMYSEEIVRQRYLHWCRVALGVDRSGRP